MKDPRYRPFNGRRVGGRLAIARRSYDRNTISISGKFRSRRRQFPDDTQQKAMQSNDCKNVQEIFRKSPEKFNDRRETACMLEVRQPQSSDVLRQPPIQTRPQPKRGGISARPNLCEDNHGHQGYFFPGHPAVGHRRQRRAKYIVTSRDAAGQILDQTAETLAVDGGQATGRQHQTCSRGSAWRKNDNSIRSTKSTDIFTAAQLFGGEGNDTLTGGSATILLSARTATDKNSASRNDQLWEGDGNGTRTWHRTHNSCSAVPATTPPTPNDLEPGWRQRPVRGGDGIIPPRSTGANGAEVFTHHAQRHARALRSVSRPFSLDIGTTEILGAPRR